MFLIHLDLYFLKNVELTACGKIYRINFWCNFFYNRACVTLEMHTTTESCRVIKWRIKFWSRKIIPNMIVYHWYICSNLIFNFPKPFIKSGICHKPKNIRFVFLNKLNESFLVAIAVDGIICQSFSPWIDKLNVIIMVLHGTT